MTQPTPKEMLDLIIASAGPLRAAGVLRVQLGECQFDLAVDAEPMVMATQRDSVEDSIDPLSDPLTFNVDPRRTDITLPGFRRPPKLEE